MDVIFLRVYGSVFNIPNFMMSRAGFNAEDEVIYFLDIMEILNLCHTFDVSKDFPPGYCQSYGTDSLKQAA